MKDSEQKVTETVYTDIAQGQATEGARQSLLLRYPRLFGLLIAGIFILSTVFIHQRFLKRDPITFSSEISATTQKTFTDKITVEKGQTIGKILSSYGLSHNQINEILKASSLQKVDLKQLSTGQVLEVQYVMDASQAKVLNYLVAHLNYKSKLKIVRDSETNSFKASVIAVNLIKEFTKFSGKIKNSLMVSAIHAGVPIYSLIEATNACSYEVDFQRDIKDGDSFKVLVEKFTSKEDGSVFFGKTVFFALDLSGKQYKIYKFKPQNAQEEFFTDSYQSAKRGLLKTPVSVMRISGKFGMRRHPILGYSLMHRGIDFAAPHGTPIYSAGDGVIATMEKNSGLGNHIKIRHNGRLTTVYGHISRFAKALKKGARVKQGQIIAFVGATGRATGPHLHYEILVNGSHVDPLKFKLPSTTTLKGQDVVNFKSHKAHIDSLLGKELF
jgi:murein DD-endopeptidase MepM/ murein hydrolase activator NlpD